MQEKIPWALPALELVSHRLCPYVQRSVITLCEKNIPHRRRSIDLSNKPDWFRRLSPLGKVPLLRVDDRVVFESAVICEYLDEITPGSLHPDDPLEKATHRSWIEFGSAILDTIAGFYAAKDAARFELRRLDLINRLQWLERNLGPGPYFGGPDFTLVDAAYGPLFRYFDVFETVADFGFFDGTPRVSGWRAALKVRPSVRDAVETDYPSALLDFVVRRDGYLSSLIADDAVPAAVFDG